MPKVSKVESTNLDDLASQMEVTLKVIDKCKSGEVLSKNKSVQLLTELRRHLSSLEKKCKGARKHSFELQELLVPKKEMFEEPVIPDLPKE